MAEGLTDVTVGPLLAGAAVVCGVCGGAQHLVLRGTVLRVVQVEAVTDVTEETGRGLLLKRRLSVTAVEDTGVRLCVTN